MTLDTLIEQLNYMDGYMASAIINANGQILFAHSSLLESDLTILAESMNTIFHDHHLESAKEPHHCVKKSIVTVPNGIHLVACLGVHAPVHLHFIVMLDRNGNQELMKIALDKIIAKTLEMIA
jgi:hypothetical protein